MLAFGKFLLVLYLIVAIVLYVSQRKMLYFPSANNSAVQQDEIVFSVNDQKLQAWQVNAGQAKALVYFGGNAEAVDINIDEFRLLFPRHTIYLIAYRGYGASTGSPSEKSLNEDALAIYDLLADDYENISVMGRSLGSGVAVHLSALRSIDKLILVTPFDSILNVAQDLYWMFPLSILLKDKFESWRKVKDIKADSLIIIAEQDLVIPAKYGKNLHNYFSQKSKLKIIPLANHNTIGEFPAYQQAITEFMQ